MNRPILQKADSVWRDKNVVVVGASSGIGRAVAERCIAEGAKVGVIARRKNMLDEIAGAFPYTADVSDKERISHAIAAYAHECEAPIDALFHIAGISSVRTTEIQDMPMEELRQLMSVNVLGARNTYKAAQPFLAEDARIAFCSSGIAALPEMYPFEFYRLSKKFLEAYAQHLRTTLAAECPNQSVTILQPGFVETEIWDKGDARYLPEFAKIFGRLGFSAETCATQIMGDVSQRKSLSHPTPDAAFLHKAQKIFPELFAGVAQHVGEPFMKRAIRRK